MNKSPNCKETSVRSVKLRNYKSVGLCDVSLGALCALVGRNGAGKSNFLDALSFVADALTTSLDHAIRDRGGIDAVRRRSTGHPRNTAIEVEIALPESHIVRYGFELAARKPGGFTIKSERLVVYDHLWRELARFHVKSGEVVSSYPDTKLPTSTDRLYLVAASSLPQFRRVYDALVAMGFYNLNPRVMKDLQAPDAGEILRKYGGNVASVLARLSRADEDAKRRIEQYLSRIVPSVSGVDRVALGSKETLEFRQEVSGAQYPWRFYAESMSDGTLRVLGALIAVFQVAGQWDSLTLVGIEEPEAALHPAAAIALMDALMEASERTQVLVTTHSPDLLEHPGVDARSLLVVESVKGETVIAGADRVSREAVRDHLYTAGELHRQGQLMQDEQDVERQRQAQLFRW